jgi:hypothetical protein
VNGQYFVICIIMFFIIWTLLVVLSLDLLSVFFFWGSVIMWMDSILVQAQSPLSLQWQGWRLPSLSLSDRCFLREGGEKCFLSAAVLVLLFLIWMLLVPDLKLASRAHIWRFQARHFWGGQHDKGGYHQGEGEFVLRLLNSMQRAHMHPMFLLVFVTGDLFSHHRFTVHVSCS